jgi:hypothetical protein
MAKTSTTAADNLSGFGERGAAGCGTGFERDGTAGAKLRCGSAMNKLPNAGADTGALRRSPLLPQG